MLIFLMPIVIGFLAISLTSIGYNLRTGRKGTKFERWCFRYNNVWGVTTFFSFAALAIMLVGLACSRVEYASFPARYEAVITTLIESRKVGSSGLERAAVTHKIIDMNKELATIKYWDDSIWVGWFYPDRVAGLELIK